ncbi:MAG: PKD domain-containing protein, partial [Sinomicrobium sp.]|nr:PKD domain-containing protein [Sinomicrobium sp.]
MKKFLLILSTSILYLVPTFGQYGYIQYNSPQHQFRIKNPVQPEPAPKATKPAVWGNYFWEFGDGHYSFDSLATHHYAADGIYNVQLFLTPYYSFSAPRSYERSFSVEASDGRPPVYSMNNQLVNVFSTAGAYLVPGHDMQFVLHYKAPAAQAVEAGYVLLFYNNKAEKNHFKINFNPLGYVGERLYYQEEALGDDFFGLPTEALPAEGLALAKELFNQHDEVRIFKVTKLHPGEERRLFCTMTSDLRLENHQDKNRDISISTLWLPEGVRFDKKQQLHVQTMEILKVHDPNSIRVQKKNAYFRPQHRTLLNYKVSFQNNAPGVVEDVVVRIPIPGELNISTVKIREDQL